MILICDDDATVRSSLTLVLKRAGYKVATAATPEEVLDFVRKTKPALILMDMNYTHATTGEEGLELLTKTKIFCPDVPVILITAWGSIELAVKGMKAGAFDFVTKPWNNLVLLNTIRTALDLNNLSTEEHPERSMQHFEKIVGRSPLLLQILETVSRIAPTNASVLITGESGTGKELIAEAVHMNSQRSSMPFVKVNLGGISQSLFESEMFGHKKGAFTDAYHDRTGRFEMANKGSIFLDEIGELDQVSQVKLLRVLQDQTFEMLGDSRPKQVDTRIICATNRDLAEMVTKGTFREDLFYRINLITIRMPALRERKDDIPLLVDHFVKLHSEENKTSRKEIAAEAILWLQQLPYPGNIRELKNLVERTLLVSAGQVVTETDFKSQYIEFPVSTQQISDMVSLEKLEQDLIRKTLKIYGGNLSKTASALGMTRQSLYRRMEKYTIQTFE